MYKSERSWAGFFNNEIEFKAKFFELYRQGQGRVYTVYAFTWLSNQMRLNINTGSPLVDLVTT